jgi:site-specific DNA recombinase
MNGVTYCRVSSKEQIEGTSLESQEAACREFAQARNIKILKVFVEQGESAKFADRTQLLELIDFCRQHKGEIETLLVWKVDRFARNVADHYSVKATLAKYGVRIVSVTEPIDANPEGKLMETILAGFAQFDNDIRAMRTVQGMRRKIHEGIFPWGPPLGYKSSVVNGEKKTVPDLPDERTFTLLQRAWKEFATGKYTQAEMGRRMQSWGMASATGRPFSPQSLYQLFTNVYYEGMLVDPWEGKEYNGKHVPMVSKEEFAKVQQVIARRDRSISHHKDRPDFPLRGIVRCDGCHQYLTGAFSRGRSRRYPYYLCQAVHCAKRGKSHRAGDVHDEFQSFLDEVAPKQELLEKLGDLIVKEATKRQSESETRTAGRRHRVAQLDRQVQELIRMRSQALITDKEFLHQKKLLLDQQAAIEASHPPRRINVAEVRCHLRETISPLSQLRNTWQSLQPPFRRRFERLVLPVGFLIGQIRTADLGLLFRTFGAFQRSDSSGVPLAYDFSNQIMQEILAFREIFAGLYEEEAVPKRQFENSHRNRLRWRNSNPMAA